MARNAEMADIRITGQLPRRQNVSITLPAQQMIETTLSRNENLVQVPTLISVERIVDRLSAVGLVVQDPEILNHLAKMVNHRFLTVPRESWTSTEIKLPVVSVSDVDRPIFAAVNALRDPVLGTAEALLHSGTTGGVVPRRSYENGLVDSVTAIVRDSSDIWRPMIKVGLNLMAKTMLTVLTQSLIAVPLVDVVQAALSGVHRRI